MSKHSSALSTFTMKYSYPSNKITKPTNERKEKKKKIPTFKYTQKKKKQNFTCGKITPHIQLFHFQHPLFTYSRLWAEVQTLSYSL